MLPKLIARRKCKSWKKELEEEKKDEISAKQRLVRKKRQ
jgi:hypothetical protein